jgi:hypothetical protein
MAVYMILNGFIFKLVTVSYSGHLFCVFRDIGHDLKETE